MAKQKQVKKKTNNGYKMPEPIGVGEILTDLHKKQWRLGPSIGKGGFGEIYSAQDATSTSKEYEYVVKIEPHQNGPLFVEMHFYMKFGKPPIVQEFQQKKNLNTFGMPVCHGHGSHEYKNEKYRFLVLDRLGKDLQKVLGENNKKLSVGSAFKVAVQILHVLEYIHSKDYVHADIKAANILFGTTKDTCNQAYLVDFGLASKYTTEKVFKPNPKKAHDGTIEFLSRDAHKGVQTRRGDLEILAYNLIYWLSGKLPWEKKLADPNAVHASKTECMDNLTKFMDTCFGSSKPPDALLKYLKYIKSLEHNTSPDYEKIRKLFLKQIEEAGDHLDKPFDFSIEKASGRKLVKRKSTGRLSFSVKKKKIAPIPIPKIKPLARLNTQDVPIKKLDKVKVKLNKEEQNGDIYNGFTPEMKAIMEKKLSKAKTKRVKTTKPKPSNKRSKKDVDESNDDSNNEMEDGHENNPEENIMRRKKADEASTSSAKSPTGRSRRNLNTVSYSEKTPTALRKLLKKK